MACRGSSRARLVGRDRDRSGRFGQWRRRACARCLRRRRRHDRSRERCARSPPPDRHARAGHRRVLLPRRDARAARTASRRHDRRARGRPTARSRRRVRTAAPLRPTRRRQRQPRARAPRRGDGLVLRRRARPLRGAAPERRALGPQRAARHLGCVPARRVEPARAGDDGARLRRTGRDDARPRDRRRGLRPVLPDGLHPVAPTRSRLPRRPAQAVPSSAARSARFDGEGDGLGCER